jgi:RNA polymerase sigma factor (sigma-70 family)
MATGRLADLVRSVRGAAPAAGAAPPTDGALLDAFLRRRDGDAFEALVRRHGPMVLGACRRILGNAADAEDAFQATFLALARKADSVRPRELVGNWLYGVAYRTALRARGLAARRRGREKQVDKMPDAASAEPDDRGDLQAALDQELSALPEAYRAAVVLCDLGGKTQREAARHLRVAEGTVSSRLARGRALLRRRLAGRGVTPAVAAGALAAHAPAAGVPRALVRSTVEAAGRLAAGPPAVVPPKVAALVEGVTKAMFLSKLKVMMALPVALAAAAALGLAGGGAASGDDKPGDPSRKRAVPAPAKAGADEPISPIWITRKAVQQELRLSERQVREIAEVRAGVARKHEAELRDGWAAAAEGDFKRARQVQDAFQEAEREAFSEAAPRIVSGAALGRLRQIQRQARGRHRGRVAPPSAVGRTGRLRGAASGIPPPRSAFSPDRLSGRGTRPGWNAQSPGSA